MLKKLPTPNSQLLTTNRGYTLAELLAVTSIIVIVSGLIVGVLYSTLRGGNKTKVTNDVSQNVNYALSVISNTAINAEKVTEVGGASVLDCTANPTGNSIEFEQRDGRRIKFECDAAEESIASTSASITTYLIDNNSVKVDPLTCSFSCVQPNANPYSQPIITVSFTVSQRGT
jgi:prepilin-type N-terminal cleavage/methylation domain-containing protein